MSEDDSGDGDSASKKSTTTASNSSRVRLDQHHLFLLAMSLQHPESTPTQVNYLSNHVQGGHSKILLHVDEQYTV